MNLDTPKARVTVLVATVLVVVLASVGAPYLQAFEQEPTTYPGYNATDLVPERTAAQGVPAVQEAETRGTVLIDTIHSNRFTRSDIRPLTEALADAGYRVEFTKFARPISGQLRKADAYVVIDPGKAYSPEEAEMLSDFAADGGRVLLVGEPARSTVGLLGLGVIPVRSRMASVAEPFGITFGNTYLYNMERNDGNYLNVIGSGTDRGALSEDVDELVAYTGTHVSARDGTPVVRASDGTRSGRTGTAERYQLAVVSGNALAVGDKAFLMEGSFSVADNDQFLANVVEFLTSGDRQFDLLDFPYVVDRNPTVVYTSTELLGAAQEINRNLGSDRGEPRVELERGTPDQQEADVLVATFEDLARRGITGTGIRAGGGRVSVGPYESDLDGVTVIHAPQSGYDLVVAADSVERVREAADVIAAGEVGDNAITDRTAVIRDEDDTDADTTPPPPTETETEPPTGNATATTPAPGPPGTPAG